MKNSEDNRKRNTTDSKSSKESRKTGLAQLTVGNILIICTAESIIGMSANVVIYLIGWIVTLSGNAPKYYTAEISSKTWLFLAFVSMLVCGIGMYYSSKMVGSRPAEHRYNHHNETAMSIPIMLISVLGGNILHGLLCLSMSFITIQTLFISAPLQYIARYLTGIVHSASMSAYLVIPMSKLLPSIAIYIAILSVICFVGYAVGYRKTIKDILTEEKSKELMSRTHVTTDEYSYEKNVTINAEVFKKIFPTLIEKRLRKINRHRIIADIIFIVVWFAVDMAIWMIWSHASGRDLLSPSAAFFTLLLIVPFYPMRIHERLISKTYYGVVTDIKVLDGVKTVKTVASSSFGRVSSRRYGMKTAIMYVRSVSGLSTQLEFPGIAELPYKIGDRVLKLSAFKYPIKTSLPDDEIFCPGCARVYPAKTAKCKWCGTKLK